MNLSIPSHKAFPLCYFYQFPRFQTAQKESKSHILGQKAHLRCF